MNAYNENIRRVGIYGGTFAPPHNGHVEAAKAFMRQMRLDYLFVIPAAIPPHKQLDFVADPLDRLKMCELAFSGIEGVIVSDLELRRGGVSYTVDTLRELTAPDTRLFLFCGTDMFLTLDSWKHPEIIFALSRIAHVRREDVDEATAEKIAERTAYYRARYGGEVIHLDTPVVEISSTEIRTLCGQGRDISHLVPAPVCDYIAAHRLYGNSAAGGLS